MNFQTSPLPDSAVCPSGNGCTVHTLSQTRALRGVLTLPSCSLSNPSPSPVHPTSHFYAHCLIASLHPHLGYYTPASSLALLLPVIVPQSLALQSQHSRHIRCFSVALRLSPSPIRTFSAQPPDLISVLELTIL